MKTRYSIVLAALAGSFLGLSVAKADTTAFTNPTAQGSGPNQNPPMISNIIGVVQSVDQTSGAIVVHQDNGSTSSVNVDSSVTLIRQGQTVKVSDLKPGDTITVNRDSAAPAQQ